MAQVARLAGFALILTLALASSASAARQLQQSTYTGTIVFPGCTFLSDSEIAKNSDFSTLYRLLQSSGLNQTLSNLSSPATLFAPTNKAFSDFSEAANLTVSSALSQQNLQDTYDALLFHVVSGAILSTDDFQDGQVLNTLLSGANLTIATDEINSTEYITVDSFGAEATIVTPAAFACNLVIYGINGVLVSEMDFPFDEEFAQYLETILLPGGAEIPLSLVVAAVAAGKIDTVADVFDQAISDGYLQQLAALVEQATSVPNGVETLAAVAEEMIALTSCSRVTPLVQLVNPTQASLGVDDATLQALGAQFPLLTSCVLSQSQA